MSKIVIRDLEQNAVLDSDQMRSLAAGRYCVGHSHPFEPKLRSFVDW